VKFAAKQLTLHTFMKITLVTLFCIALVTGCGTFSKVLKSDDIEYKYKKAVGYFKDEKYSYVIQIMDDRFFPLLKGSDKFEEAFYMLAYSHYYEKDYFNAENLFRQYAETFPKSARAVDMEYMRAYTYYKQSPKVELEQTNTLKAIGMLNSFINQHPDTEKAKEAAAIVDLCRAKIELKDFKAAELYYRMGQYRAASVAFGNMITTYPESTKADEYKFMAIKAFYQFATLSVDERKEERFEQVIADCNDFLDKFPESKLIKEIERYNQNSVNNIKTIKNEQTKTAISG
jgi:outer membrane protein assembly factor BamD